MARLRRHSRRPPARHTLYFVSFILCTPLPSRACAGDPRDEWAYFISYTLCLILYALYVPAPWTRETSGHTLYLILYALYFILCCTCLRRGPARRVGARRKRRVVLSLVRLVTRTYSGRETEEAGRLVTSETSY